MKKHDADLFSKSINGWRIANILGDESVLLDDSGVVVCRTLGNARLGRIRKVDVMHSKSFSVFLTVMTKEKQE